MCGIQREADLRNVYFLVQNSQQCIIDDGILQEVRRAHVHLRNLGYVTTFFIEVEVLERFWEFERNLKLYDKIAPLINLTYVYLHNTNNIINYMNLQRFI